MNTMTELRDITNLKINSSKLQKREEISKFDAELSADERFSVTYITETMEFLFSNQKAMTDYASVNDRIRQRRRVMLKWIRSLHTRFQLYDNTLYLAVNIVDRYFASLNAETVANMSNKELQLVGCSVLWIASKYHEIYAPEPEDFKAVSHDDIDSEELQEMEITILQAIDFDLTVETPLCFSERFYQIGCYFIRKSESNPTVSDKKQKILKSFMMYCGEICMDDYELSLELPSKIACAILYYCCIGTGIFSFEKFVSEIALKHVNGCTLQDCQSIMEIIHQKAITDKKSQTFAKYATSETYYVTQIPAKMYDGW